MPEREAVKLASYLLQRLQNARQPVFLVGIEVQLGRERSARLTRFADAFTQRLDKGMMQRGSFDVSDHTLTDSES